ncbi:hypothetical protein [Natrinema gari]|uniref:Uncharacterized protein n=1 Tax=Natrinema gari JCM 14663 TaxID=1230459 RepID=L9ZF40_9EURY|nr:hypothetical protein [Natrinema gari]ELY85045.1 hypothetical protein C486_00375 [Natrinema gari JCM 14663]
MARAADGGDRAAERIAVRERLEELIHEDDQIHGLAVTRREGETIYAVVARSTTWDQIDDGPDLDIPILDLRTVVADFEADSLKLTGNGLAVPHESGVADVLTQLLARSTTNLNRGSAADASPLLVSATDDVDPQLLLEREITDRGDDGQDMGRMKREPGIDPSREWGYGAGPPPEIQRLIDRFEEIGRDPNDIFIRLRFGKKNPYDSPREPVPVSELKGNYGVEFAERNEGLLALDLDYPDEFPEDEIEIPETFEVTSPHGDDSQRHIYLYCENKEKIADRLGGAWGTQALSWGDLWVGTRYVVGPGSQLSEYGCDTGDHTAGEPGGCELCCDPERGTYRIVNDTTIATVDAETIIDLIDQDLADVDEPVDDTAGDEISVKDDLPEDHVRCNGCGEAIKESEAKKIPFAGETRYIHRGGCE